jgi:hypothetical protein
VLLSQDVTGRVYVYDLLGRELLSERVVMGLNTLPLDHDGIAVVKFVSEAGSRTEKLHIR